MKLEPFNSNVLFKDHEAYRFYVNISIQLL
jgi:hypothetical protein